MAQNKQTPGPPLKPDTQMKKTSLGGRTCMLLPMLATRTWVSVARMGVPAAAARSLACPSMMANTRSMPMLTPTAGTSLPLNMPTSLSYLCRGHGAG
jgi:hypothetical protein